MPLPLALFLPGAAIAASPLALALWNIWRDRPIDVSLAGSRGNGVGLSGYFVYDTLVEPDLMLTTYGGLGTIYQVTWDDTSVSDDDDLVRHNAWKNDALRRLGTGWMAQNYAIPSPIPPPAVPNYIVNDEHRIIAESHIDSLASVSRVRWRFLTAFAYVPPSVEQSWLKGLVFSGEPPTDVTPEKVKANFERQLVKIEGSLQRAGRVRRLGTHTHDTSRNEMLEAIFEIAYGDMQRVSQPMPFEPFDVRGILAARDVSPVGLRPKIGDKHLRVLSVFGLPLETEPNMMETFLRSPVPGCVFSQRMIFQEVEQAMKKLDYSRRAYKGKKKSAVADAVQDGNSATDEFAAINEKKAAAAKLTAAMELVAWTHFSSCVVLQDENLERMAEKVNTVRKTLEAHGFVVNLEENNAFDAYLGHLPFDGYHNVREGQVHTANIARMWPSSSRWPGRQSWNCKQCPTAKMPVLESITETGEPFYFDPHDDENQNFIEFGSPGCGKTTRLNALAAAYRRGPLDQVFSIDKNNGQLVTCKFFGGDYRENARYWLFGNLENDDKRANVRKFLTDLGAIHGVPITSEQRDDVQKVLRMMLHDEPQHRSLSTFTNLLSAIDKEGVLSKTLSQYAEGGVYRGVFDGTSKDGGENSYEVHELGTLLGGQQDDLLAAPVILWVLNLFAERLPGHRTIIPWEEAWSAFGSDVVAAIVGELLRTLRFRHAGIGFYTHSLADVRDSLIGKIMVATCPTRIIHPNREAAGEFRSFFEGLDLNNAQIEAIKNGTPKVDTFLAADGKFGGSKTQFSPAELAIFGCTSKNAVSAARKLMLEYPDTWKERHMRDYGCTVEADKLRSLRRQHITHPDAIKEAVTV